MSAPGRAWPGHSRPGRRLHVSNHQLADLREQVDALLAWAEASPEGTWHIADEERAFMASLSELFGVPIPLGTFRSAEGAAKFLRVVAFALE